MSRDPRPVPEIALEWLDEGRLVAIATLVNVIGSAPMDPGAAMVFDDAENLEGSVTGGCVEAALAQEAVTALEDGEARVCTYGISDDLAGTVGLMCGGTVEILVSPAGEQQIPVLRAVADALAEEQPVALAMLTDGPSRGGMLAVTSDSVTGRLEADPELGRAVADDAAGALAQSQTITRRYGPRGERAEEEIGVFIQSFAVAPRIIVCGAVEFAVALARQAQELGYRVTVCDPRKSFAGAARLRAVAEVVSEWPDAYIDAQDLSARDAVLIFTHDPKLDEPAALAALRTNAGYIGALGSRRTHRDRVKRLKAAGVSGQELARITSPAGLDIGSATPAETALAILAEMTARRHGRRGGPLFDSDGSIRPHLADSG